MFIVKVVGRVIETRTVARTPGVQAQFVTLTVPTNFAEEVGFEPTRLFTPLRFQDEHCYPESFSLFFLILFLYLYLNWDSNPDGHLKYALTPCPG